MKLQCSCGAKYEFEITPEMVAQPVRFVCPACGADSSDFVNQLVRQQFGAQAAPASEPEAPRPRVARRVETPAVESPGAAVPEAAATVVCSKHPGMVAVENCRVCGKPMCPKCMELFGYVCSPLCKANAERRRLEIPVFKGQKSIVEARHWRKVGLACALIGILLVALLGAWGWYAWFGSQPHVVFSTRFTDPAYSGQTRMCGADQLVALHGASLARYDLKQKREVWSHRVLEKRDVASSFSDSLSGGAKEEYEESALRLAASQLELRVFGQNIWVLTPTKLIQFDFNTGQPLKQTPLNTEESDIIERGDELLIMGMAKDGKQTVQRWDLAKAQSRTDEIVLAKGSTNTSGRVSTGTMAASRTSGGGGLPINPAGKTAGAPLDPMKIAAQAQALSKPAKIALPALLANSMNQERILAELNETAAAPASGRAAPASTSSSLLLPTQDGFIHFAVKLIESRIVTRSAMKAPPAKSVLNGDLKVTQTTEVANEILNDMQRARGGDIVREDESFYQVTLSQPDGSHEWTGQVTGPPALHALETVNVLTAGHTLYVFNRANQLQWKSELAFRVQPEEAVVGRGPCVEREGSLFVFDQGVVAAFDLASGNARWRLPSIGVQGLLFDQEGMLYINTTTASPDKLKFSRQIDISEKIAAEILKVDARTGKTLWSAHPGGFVTCVDGKFVYTVQSFTPDEDQSTPNTGFETPAYTRVRRLDPKTGKELWQYFQDRAPLDVQFDRNNIRLVFKKEVQVVSFLSF